MFRNLITIRWSHNYPDSIHSYANDYDFTEDEELILAQIKQAIIESKIEDDLGKDIIVADYNYLHDDDEDPVGSFEVQTVLKAGSKIFKLTEIEV